MMTEQTIIKFVIEALKDVQREYATVFSATDGWRQEKTEEIEIVIEQLKRFYNID